MPASSVGYVVRIFLYQCTDLLASDSALAGGKSDPYVEFTLGKKTLRSSRHNNELNPVWSPPEKFEFTIDSWEHEFISVRVFDHDLLSADDLLGSAAIPLGLFAGDRHTELYRYPLVLPEDLGPNGPRSDIHLQITLTRTDGKPIEYFYY